MRIKTNRLKVGDRLLQEHLTGAREGVRIEVTPVTVVERTSIGGGRYRVVTRDEKGADEVHYCRWAWEWEVDTTDKQATSMEDA